MKSSEIRNAFIQFFNEREHQTVSSSSLVPGNDPTLLFTNAGMVQFKEVFLGLEKRPYSRAVSSQRCVRAGGKHNDLENVGYTARHHTFFEMLGNFSFGDYFKKEAIEFAWEFLTKILNLPPERLWVTVYKDDQESEELWFNHIKIDQTRFTRCGDKDNFWSMGDTGPCGPCTEIFYDHGSDIPGGPPGSPDEDGDRYVEIWNLVFMQYDRQPDGELLPLPKPSVDTGMGLERIAAVVQGVHSNYDIDLFQALIKATAKILGTDDLTENSLKVIADHIRATAFLITDGVIPSNEGRGYVLRRIIRRAIRHAHTLGMKDTFFYKLVPTLVELMGEAYPELAQAEKHIQKLLLKEEEQFDKTLDQGLKILQQAIDELKGKELPGDLVFKLYDTYGFPVDLTNDIAREQNVTLDMAGFEENMQQQRAQSQQASQFQVDYSGKVNLDFATEFLGYKESESESEVVALLKEGETVSSLSAGEIGAVVLARTPFYAESGGQMGDAGELRNDNAHFDVMDTQNYGDAVLHQGRVEKGSLKVGDKLVAKVANVRRQAIKLNHSATHLLHAALRHVLGEHVQQQGSLVAPDRLRFDFSHYAAVTAKELQTIEALVNSEIRANHVVQTEIMTPDEAQAGGAVALFGEKYGENVRVLSMGDFSKELCGGTHVTRTGDIGLFKITTETGIAAGIRRIEAVTGVGALEYTGNLEDELREIATLLKVDRKAVATRVKQQADQTRQLEKTVEKLKQQLASSKGSDLLDQAQEFSGVKVLVTKVENIEPKSLRNTMDQLKDKLGAAAVVVIAAVNGDRLNAIAGLSKEVIGKAPSPKELVTIVCGKGGGRDDMAQSGGAVPADLDARLKQVLALIQLTLEAA